MLMLFYYSLAHAEASASVTRRLPFLQLPFQGGSGIALLCQEMKVSSATSSQPGKLNLLEGHGTGSIEMYRKG